MDNPFKIESWTPSGKVEEVMAIAENLLIARAAFREAVKRYPKAHLTLRQGARVVEEHKPGGPLASS
jgi:hypothetical protein